MDTLEEMAKECKLKEEKRRKSQLEAAANANAASKTKKPKNITEQ